MIAGSTTPSTLDIELALWDHSPGSTAPPMLLAHATGFHGRIWDPIAARFAVHDRWHPYSVDLRGHGDTPAPPDSDPLDWGQFTADVLASVDAFGLDRPVGVGHSMGGASLLGAELARPGTFAALAVFEPVIFPPTRGPEGANALAEMTKRRRAEFASLDEAHANFASKPPMGAFDPEVLDAYVRHAFRPTGDGDAVTLKCTPAFESSVYASDKTDVWGRLGEIGCPVLVIGGADVGPHPLAQFVSSIAQLLPRGQARIFEQMAHFGPLTHPEEFSTTVSAFFDDVLT